MSHHPRRDGETPRPEAMSAPDRETTYEIPVEGSLGLLALGARGLTAWRRVRDEAARPERDDAPSAAPASDED